MQRIFYDRAEFKAGVKARFLPLWICFILAASIGLFSGKALAQGETFTAIVTSDLHYSVSSEPSSSVVPGMAFLEEITDAIFDEVIDRHPDYFIITGDLTNGGDAASLKALAEKFLKVKAAGIQLAIIPGNHDFEQSDREQYEAYFLDLSAADEHDSASSSYAVDTGAVVLLTMDDSSYTLGKRGLFSDDTMEWLRSMLEKYEGRQMVLLSHRTALSGKDVENSGSYHIQNESLFSLLESYDVRLLLCGHLHSQSISNDHNMYEIISAMPLSGSHLIGFLTITDGQLDYHTESVDLEKYGEPDWVNELEEAENALAAENASRLSGLIEESGYNEEEQEQILNLIFRFFQYYADGSMADHREEILSDPAWQDMLDALWDHNYGPWMAQTIENADYSANRLAVQLW